MRIIFKIATVVISMLIIINPSFAKGLSEETDQVADKQANMKRTQQLIDNVENYLRANDTYVGIIARRGAGNPETGVSDTDDLDLSGMAHSGFVIRNGFGKNANYITFNLVRMKGAKSVAGKESDLSELRVWSLPHFFIGAFEKDAIVFLPEKKVQLKLWNLLRANGQLRIEPKKRYITDKNGKPRLDTNGNPVYLTDQIVANGAFPLFHNPEYNLLSDYVEKSTQNCNEHLLKTYIGFRDFWQPTQPGYDVATIEDSIVSKILSTTSVTIEKNFTPRQMVLSRTKSTFAFVQNVRLGERHEKAPTFLGFKLNKEKFEIASIDSFCEPQNQGFLKWADFKVFREDYSKNRGWFIEDRGRDYVKINRITRQPNTIKEI